jgi:hypothetical protein
MTIMSNFKSQFVAIYHITDYESNQQNVIIQVNLLFLVGSTCFGR